MENNGYHLTCNEVRDLDIVDYLSTLGFQPTKIIRKDYWYLSPLRTEKTASFKINRGINRWYDHGIGRGGNLIDFAMLYHRCTIAELMEKFRGNLIARPPHSNQQEPFKSDSNIEIIHQRALSSLALLVYLKQRNISRDIASRFCQEIHYRLNQKNYYSIGFRNNAGGFELRNSYCKNSSSPKDITTIKNGEDKVAVFEGFFDFLSFQVLFQNTKNLDCDYCILNSISFFGKVVPLLSDYKTVHLFLDNDAAGQNCSLKAMHADKRYVDESSLYKGYKDLNEWTVMMGKQQMEKQALGESAKLIRGNRHRM